MFKKQYVIEFNYNNGDIVKDVNNEEWLIIGRCFEDMRNENVVYIVIKEGQNKEDISNRRFINEMSLKNVK